MSVVKQRGFTLLEIAIVIVIVGILTALGAGMLTTMLKRTNAAATRANADVVRQALTRFIGTYNRLPCPAQPLVNSTNAAYGVEDAFNCANTVVAATGTARGVVPWKSLGLQQDNAQDGYGRFFSYTVTVPATQTTSANVAALRGLMTLHSGTPVALGLPPTGNQINSCSNTLVPPPGGDDGNGCNLRSVVMLISHGENGLGAFNPSGVPSPPPTSPTEIENVDANLAFVNSEVSSGVGTEFDDVVYAWSPADFIDALASQGQFKSAATISNEALRNYAAVISNGIVNGTFGTPHLIPIPPLPSPPQDGWLNPIAYSTTHPGADACSLSNTAAFTLTSRGVDGVADPNTATNRSDDITVTVSVDAIRSQILNSGPCP